VNGQALLALQLHDTHLDALDGRRKRLPERAAVASARAELAELAEERARLQSIVQAAATSIEQAEASGVDLDTKQRRLEAQLKTVIAPREAEALMHEIELLQSKHSELDDAELEAMERQGDAEAAMAELDAREPALLEAAAAADALLAQAEAAIAEEVAAITSQRAEAAASVTDSEMSLYTSMRARHGGMGIAQLERHTCTGCHVDLSQVEYERVVADTAASPELPECPHCARLLVV
jgi:uncharacterized protein